MHTLAVRIADIGYYLPERRLDNRTLVEDFDNSNWTEEKIMQKVGINNRYICNSNEYVSDMAVAAVINLQQKSEFDVESIDFLILCTQTPDHALPATSCKIQENLNLPKTCMSFDFNQGCSGYVYGLGIAGALIASGQAERGLLVTGEAYSKWIHPKDRITRTIFGDAATATLLEACPKEKSGLGPFIYGTDGSGYDRLIVPCSGAHAMGIDPSQLNANVDESGNVRRQDNLFMDGPEIFRFAVTTVPNLFKALMHKAEIELDQIDHIILHQANMFMLEYLTKIMKIPKDKMIYEIEDVGNTVSCTIPLAIARAAEDGRMLNGARLALIGFGVGYSWSAGLARWR